MAGKRLSIGWLMALIGIIAVNIAAIRALVAREPTPLWLGGLYPTAVALQAGLLGLARRRGPSRAYWAGFVAGGLVALGSVVCYFVYPRETVTVPGGAVTLIPGPWVTRCWDAYSRAIEPLLAPLAVSGWLDRPLVQLAVVAVAATLPQLAIAGLVGLATRTVFLLVRRPLPGSVDADLSHPSHRAADPDEAIRCASPSDAS